MKKYRKHIALYLLIALAPIIVPRVYFHAFVHHSESEHITCSSSESEQIGIEHEHCSLLHFSAPSIDTFVPDFAFDFTSYYKKIAFHFVSAKFSGVKNFSDLRGPPQI